MTNIRIKLHNEAREPKYSRIDFEFCQANICFKMHNIKLDQWIQLYIACMAGAEYMIISRTGDIFHTIRVFDSQIKCNQFKFRGGIMFGARDHIDDVGSISISIGEFMPIISKILLTII